MSTSETKSPAEERAERLASLRTRWNSVAGRATLGYLLDEIEDTQGEIDTLPGQIEGYRHRGYCFSRDWEARAQTLQDIWPARSRDARRLQRQQAYQLKAQVTTVEDLTGRTALSERGLDRLQSELDQLESQLSSAESTVRGAYDALGQQLHQLKAEFQPVEYLLDSLETASFDLFPDEVSVAACKAVWISGRDEPEGTLFLMEGRLVFEQREKKAKKKVLFVTTAKELVQEKLWEAPIGAITEMEAEDKRKFLAKKELLHLRFRDPPPRLAGETTVRLKGTTNEEWSGLIKRVQSGEIESDRAGTSSGAQEPETGEPAAPPKEIPTKCPSCGARLPAVMKGMRQLNCEYCDAVIRL
jgi:hypothetical protein